VKPYPPWNDFREPGPAVAVPRALCLVAQGSTVRVIAQGNGERLRIAILDFRIGESCLAGIVFGPVSAIPAGAPSASLEPRSLSPGTPRGGAAQTCFRASASPGT